MDGRSLIIFAVQSSKSAHDGDLRRMFFKYYEKA